MCSACSNEVVEKGYSNNPQPCQEKYEPDIRYKKDEDDFSPTVYITKYGIRYHKRYCSHAKNVYIILTVKQALNKGYTACYYCCY